MNLVNLFVVSLKEIYKVQPPFRQTSEDSHTFYKKHFIQLKKPQKGYFH